MSAPKVDIVVGGIWHAPDLALGLSSAGWSVRVITSARSLDLPGVELRHVPVARYPLRLVSGFRRPDVAVHTAFGLAARSQLRPDAVVVAWSSFALASLVAQHRPVVISRGSTHIATQRRILMQTAQSSGLPLPAPSAAMVALERLEYARATRVTVPTPDIAADPLWSEDAAALNVAPYGFPDWAGRVRRGARARGRVVFGGEIGYRKGVDYLMAALRQRSPGASECRLFGRPVRGFPVGDIPDWWDMPGYVSSEKLHEELGSASALVLLSREEGMARVGQEALACGTPIVVSPQSGLGCWLKDGGGFVVDPHDPEAVRHALARIDADWEHHSEVALRTARSWSWEDHSRAVVEGLAGAI